MITNRKSPQELCLPGDMSTFNYALCNVESVWHIWFVWSSYWAYVDVRGFGSVSEFRQMVSGVQSTLWPQHPQKDPSISQKNQPNVVCGWPQVWAETAHPVRVLHYPREPGGHWSCVACVGITLEPLKEILTDQRQGTPNINNDNHHNEKQKILLVTLWRH